MARVGILGGSFNPPHIAHLLCAQEARDQCRLDRVILVPAATPPHKELRGDPGAEVRLHLTELAAGEDPNLEVSAIELERTGPSYTVDTLRLLNDRQPGDELILIVGGDMASSFPTWREPEAILELAGLAVAERAGARRADIVERLEPLHGRDRVTFFDLPRIDVSSSEVRRRVAAGRPIRYLVPDPVITEITARGLYRAEEEAAA